MKDILIIGAGNFGREVAQLIHDINQDKNQWNILGFIDETPEKHATVINSIPVLGGPEWLDRNSLGSISAVFAIGNPRSKYRLIRRLSKYGLDYPILIHPGALSSSYVSIGFGSIICWGCFLSVDIRIGSHVAINPGCGIGHDAAIMDYSTLYWNVTLSGNVTIQEGCEIGSKAAVIPQRTVGRWSTIGAGAVVVRDIPEFSTAVGVPARPIKYNVFDPDLTAPDPLAPDSSDSDLLVPDSSDSGPSVPVLQDSGPLAPESSDSGPSAPVLQDSGPLVSDSSDSGPSVLGSSVSELLAPKSSDSGPSASESSASD